MTDIHAQMLAKPAFVVTPIKKNGIRGMDKKHLGLILGIGAEDWERTTASVRQLVAQLGLKIEQLEQHLKELQDSKEDISEKVNRNCVKL